MDQAKRRRSHRRYNHSVKGKLRTARYRNSPKGIATRQAYQPFNTAQKAAARMRERIAQGIFNDVR